MDFRVSTKMKTFSSLLFNTDDQKLSCWMQNHSSELIFNALMTMTTPALVQLIKCSSDRYSSNLKLLLIFMRENLNESEQLSIFSQYDQTHRTFIYYAVNNFTVMQLLMNNFSAKVLSPFTQYGDGTKNSSPLMALVHSDLSYEEVYEVLKYLFGYPYAVIIAGNRETLFMNRKRVVRLITV